MWPHVFSAIADEYDRRYGLDDAHLRAIAELNLAQRPAQPERPDPRLGRPRPRSFSGRRRGQPGRRGPRCAATTAARSPTAPPGVVLVSDAWLRDHPGRRPVARIARLGPPHRRARAARRSSTRGRRRAYVLPHVRQAVTDAFDRARRRRSRTLDGIETHDCFTPTEYLAIDHFGHHRPGRGWKAVEDGVDRARRPRCRSTRAAGSSAAATRWGRAAYACCSTRPSRSAGTAGDYQVEGARTFGTLNFGGSTATTVSFVVGAVDDEPRKPLQQGDPMDVEIVGRMLSTLPADDDHPYRTGAVAAADDRVARPTTSTSSRARSPPTSTASTCATPRTRCTRRSSIYHPFDGDGMVHVVGFRDGKAYYRNRFVRTDGFARRAGGGQLAVGRARRAARPVAARGRLGRARPDEGRVEHRRHRARGARR